MQYFEYNECKQRGTLDFPIEIHHVNNQHPQYTMPYHWHMEYEIIRIIEGELHISLNERQWTAKKGDIIFINSGTLHGATPIHCIYECLVFDMNMLMDKNDCCYSFLNQIMNHSVLIQEFYPYDKTDLQRIIHSIFKAMSRKHVGYQFNVKGALYQLLGFLINKECYTRNSSVPNHNDKKILQLKQALEMIENQYSSTITLEQLSRTAGMSPKYFCRFFREMTHKSPVDYLNYYRIERASYHLIHSDQPITDIAHNCGFNDFSYFIKTFKRYKKETPKQYRLLNS